MLITRQEFREIYHGLDKILAKEEILYTKPKDKDTLIKKHFTCKLWRLNNIYSITNANAEKIRFQMRYAQHLVHARLLRHNRQIILKSRQLGISTYFLTTFFDDAIIYPNLNAGLMAQGEEEGAKLLERTKNMWEDLHPDIKKLLRIELDNNNRKEFSFSNGSNIFIRTSFRSTTLQRLHVSELAKLSATTPQRAVELQRGTLQSLTKSDKAIIAIESTAEGEGLFKDMFDTAYSHVGPRSKFDFATIFIGWWEDPDNVSEIDTEETAEHTKHFSSLEKELKIKLTKQQRNFYISKWRELGHGVFQEFPATPAEAFMKDKGGNYYAEHYAHYIRGLGREIKDLYDVNLSVNVSIDLGMNDLMVLCFFQVWEDGIRIINEYHDDSMNLKEVAEVLDKTKAELDYTYGTIHLPHDAAVRDLSAEGSQTREQILNSYGYPNTSIIPKTNSINNDREFVKEAMKHMYIDTRCTYLIKCFLNYCKEFDERRGIYKDTHRHDIFSHGADAIRYCVKGANWEPPEVRRRRRDRQLKTNLQTRHPFGHQLQL